MDEREERAERWHGALRDWPKPLSLAWGMVDPVATMNVLDGVRALRPEAPVHWLEDLGHYPQIEARHAWPRPCRPRDSRLSAVAILTRSPGPR